MIQSFSKYLPYLKTAALIIGLAVVGYILFNGAYGILAGVVGIFFHGKGHREKAEDNISRAKEHENMGDVDYKESIVKQDRAKTEHDKALELAKNETEITPRPGYHKRKSRSK